MKRSRAKHRGAHRGRAHSPRRESATGQFKNLPDFFGTLLDDLCGAVKDYVTGIDRWLMQGRERGQSLGKDFDDELAHRRHEAGWRALEGFYTNVLARLGSWRMEAERFEDLMARVQRWFNSGPEQLRFFGEEIVGARDAAHRRSAVAEMAAEIGLCVEDAGTIANYLGETLAVMEMGVSFRLRPDREQDPLWTLLHESTAPPAGEEWPAGFAELRQRTADILGKFLWSVNVWASEARSLGDQGLEVMRVRYEAGRSFACQMLETTLRVAADWRKMNETWRRLGEKLHVWADAAKENDRFVLHPIVKECDQ